MLALLVSRRGGAGRGRALDGEGIISAGRIEITVDLGSSEVVVIHVEVLSNCLRLVIIEIMAAILSVSACN